MKKISETDTKKSLDKDSCISDDLITDEFIGCVISDVGGPTTTQSYRIGFDRSLLLELGEVVGVLDEPHDSVVFGIVEEIYMFEDVPDYTQKMMESNWRFDVGTLVKRSLLAYADISLLRRYSENPKFDHSIIGITPNLPVYRVGDVGLLEAFDLKAEGVPLGVYALSSGQIIDDAVIRVELPFLLGKEAAHVNISGQSGFGKTAFALFLLKAIQTYTSDKCRVKAVIFNVKQDDLLWLDQVNDELSDDDRKLYEMCGVPATPFTNVVFYGTDEYDPISKKYKRASLRPDVKPFFWSWDDVKFYIHFAIGPSEDFDDKQLQCLHVAQDQKLPDFNAAINYALNQAKPGSGGSIHPYSWTKFARILNGILQANKGLLRQSKPIPYEDVFQENDILVIDINETFFPEYTQRLVLGKIVSDVQRLHQEKKLSADFLLFVTDELSRYASRSADEHLRKVKEIIKGIAARGRSIGTPLLAIEQFPSEIDDQILGNINTKIFTRTKQNELRNQMYHAYSDRVKFEMTNLKKGYAFAENSQFPDLIKIKYPRPPCAQKDRGYSSAMTPAPEDDAGSDVGSGVDADASTDTGTSNRNGKGRHVAENDVLDDMDALM
jgi:hypothetical protein